MHCTQTQAYTDNEVNMTSLDKGQSIFNLLEYIKNTSGYFIVSVWFSRKHDIKIYKMMINSMDQ